MKRDEVESKINDRPKYCAYFDSVFKSDKQITTVLKSSFFQLRFVARVKVYLSPNDLERVIHTFIMSRLDYCNSILTMWV